MTENSFSNRDAFFPGTRELLLGLLLVICPLEVIPQEKGQPKDPFDRYTAADGSSPGESETMIVLELHLAQVPSAILREWDEEGASAEEQRKRIEDLVEKGKARIVDSVAGVWRNGVRGRFQSAFELRYPSAFQVDGDSFTEPPFPTQFETRRIGIYLEADPVLNTEQNELNLNFAFEWSRHLGEKEGAREITERMPEDDILYPHYLAQKVNRPSTMPIGEYQILTRIQPFDP